MLKTKFRECGEVVFAEMRDKNTGIVRFAQERDAERGNKTNLIIYHIDMA